MFDKEIKKISWLKGGIWSRAYRVLFSDDSTVVVKQVGQLELNLMKFLSEREINPICVLKTFRIDHKHWVAMEDLGDKNGRFLEEKGLLKIHQNKILSRIALIHNVIPTNLKFKIPSPSFSTTLKEMKRKILFLKRKKQITFNVNSYLKKLGLLKGKIDKHRNVLCHADTYLENFLLKGNKIVFVDFEISMVFYPEIDLACLCFSMNDKEVSNSFLENYKENYWIGDKDRFELIYDFCMIYRALHVAYMLQKEGELVEDRDMVVDKALLVFVVKSLKRNLISEIDFEYTLHKIKYFDIEENKRWITDDIQEFN